MSYLEIVDVKGREILDSRGNPTVEAEVTLYDGTVARGTAPAALQQENSRRLSCVTATSQDTLARAFQKRLKI